MKNIYIKTIKALGLAGVLVIASGCATTKPVDLHDSFAVESEPLGATVYIKRLDTDFTSFELESNNASRAENSHFDGLEISNTPSEATEGVEVDGEISGEMSSADEISSEVVEVFTAETPARFSLHRKGRYAVAIVKDGYVTQTQLVHDKLTGGEVVGNVAKTTGTVLGGTLLTLLTGPIGLAVMAGSAAKKGQNMSSGKNKELSPNPLNVVLELIE